MDFSFFQPTPVQTAVFLGIVTFVVINVLWIARQAFPRVKFVFLPLAIGVWMVGHIFVGRMEIFRSDIIPPPLLVYLLLTFGVGVYFSLSKWGQQVVLTTQLETLVGLQIFRFPLELVLASLAGNGNVPIEMTFNGLNFDIITGVSAILLLVAMRFKALPDWVFWIWNFIGFGCLMVIGVVAPLSSPIPIRVFDTGPPLVLAMFAPWNWIVSICVFFALVGHLLTFRFLWSRRKKSDA